MASSSILANNPITTHSAIVVTATTTSSSSAPPPPSLSVATSTSVLKRKRSYETALSMPAVAVTATTSSASTPVSDAATAKGYAAMKSSKSGNKFASNDNEMLSIKVDAAITAAKLKDYTTRSISTESDVDAEADVPNSVIVAAKAMLRDLHTDDEFGAELGTSGCPIKKKYVPPPMPTISSGASDFMVSIFCFSLYIFYYIYFHK